MTPSQSAAPLKSYLSTLFCLKIGFGSSAHSINSIDKTSGGFSSTHSKTERSNMPLLKATNDLTSIRNAVEISCGDKDPAKNLFRAHSVGSQNT
jgi:hypothetical protein